MPRTAGPLLLLVVRARGAECASALQAIGAEQLYSSAQLGSPGDDPLTTTSAITTARSQSATPTMSTLTTTTEYDQVCRCARALQQRSRRAVTQYTQYTFVDTHYYAKTTVSRVWQTCASYYFDVTEVSRGQALQRQLLRSVEVFSGTVVPVYVIFGLLFLAVLIAFFVTLFKK